MCRASPSKTALRLGTFSSPIQIAGTSSGYVGVSGSGFSQPFDFLLIQLHAVGEVHVGGKPTVLMEILDRPNTILVQAELFFVQRLGCMRVEQDVVF